MSQPASSSTLTTSRWCPAAAAVRAVTPTFESSALLAIVSPSIKAAICNRHLLEWVCPCCKKSFGPGLFQDLTAAHIKTRHPDLDKYWEAKFLPLSSTKKDNHSRHWSSGGRKQSWDYPAMDRRPRTTLPKPQAEKGLGGGTSLGRRVPGRQEEAPTPQPVTGYGRGTSQPAFQPPATHGEGRYGRRHATQHALLFQLGLG